jgi:hypothetical protein
MSPRRGSGHDTVPCHSYVHLSGYVWNDLSGVLKGQAPMRYPCCLVSPALNHSRDCSRSSSSICDLIFLSDILFIHFTPRSSLHLPPLLRSPKMNTEEREKISHLSRGTSHKPRCRFYPAQAVSDTCIAAHSPSYLAYGWMEGMVSHVLIRALSCEVLGIPADIMESNGR